jgi:C1A family cysteine protease
MVKVSSVLIGAAAGANLEGFGYYEAKLNEWKTEFGVCEDAQAFADNEDIINTHNAEESTFKLGHNEFSCLSNKVFNERYLATPFTPKAAGATGNAIHFGNETATATEIDWTTKGAVTKVKNQGQCGSCWSFSTTGSLEGAYFNKNGKLDSFSEQQLVSCDTVDAGCNGGLMDNAFKWIEKNGGLCTEGSYPYTSGTGVRGTCKKTCSSVSGSAPKSYKDVAESDTAMMSALNIGPVSVAIEADKSVFQLYKSGVLKSKTCGTRLDHGVLAVGYGTESGTDYYKVKNSWGASWGASGYILMERGTAAGRAGMCGILSGPPSYPIL